MNNEDTSYEIIKQIRCIQDFAQSYKVKNEKSKKHLDRGIKFRCLLLEESIYLLKDGIDKLPSNRYEIGKINIAFNSIYINIRGLIDNISWILRYDYLSGTVRQESVYINNKSFRKMLNDVGYNCQVFDEFISWLYELAQKRDPVAHRLPLYIPPKIITKNEDMEKAKQLLVLAENNMEIGNREWITNLAQSKSIGTFYPVFIIDDVETGKLEFIDIYATMKNDFDMINKLIKVALI
jgi:hypothetical protein